MDNFDFCIGKKDTPVITLTWSALSFNAACVSALNSPEYVCIGLDRQSKTLAVKASTDADGACPRYVFAAALNKKTVYVAARKICAEIVKLLEIEPQNRRGIGFAAEFDGASRMLIAPLSKHTEN